MDAALITVAYNGNAATRKDVRMATQDKTVTPRRVITPKGILSYPKLFTPELGPDPAPGAKPMYSATIVFPSGTDLKEMKGIVIALAKEKWGEKAIELIRTGKIRLPFRKDAEEKGYAPGSEFINARSSERPGVVSRHAGSDGKPAPITEESGEIYAGCIVRASVSAFTYNRAGNQGISFGLNNIQKLEDGPRLDNRKKAQDEFEADLSEQPASLEGEVQSGMEDFI
jgi:hypothetical protein